MKCPDDGTLLAYLDRELPPIELREVRQHLDYCSSCSNLLREIESNLDFNQEKIGYLLNGTRSDNITGQEQVWNRLQPVIRSRKKGRTYMNLKRWSAAAVLVMVLGMIAFVPSIRTAMADFLQVFRADKIETLTLSSQEMRDIQQALQEGSTNLDLKNFGQFKTNGEPQERKLSETELGSLPFQPILAPDQEGQYSLVSIPSIEMTPQVDNVNQFLKSLGSQDLLPQALDGKTFKITMADSFVADYNDYSLMEGTSPELQVPSGIDMKDVLRPLINMPIWPEGVKEQLATIDDLEHTLVIPGENVEKVSVNGCPAVLSRDGVATLIWQNDGLFYVLTDKSGGKADLVDVAQSLK